MHYNLLTGKLHCQSVHSQRITRCKRDAVNRPEVDRASNEGVGVCGGGTHQAKG